MPGYLDQVSGITFGWADGEDDWGGPTNRSLRQLAYAGLHKAVEERSVNRPPIEPPALGDSYIVGRSPGGAWVSFSPNDIAVYGRAEGDPATLGWISYTPRKGFFLYDASADTMVLYDGTSWRNYSGGSSGGGSSLLSIFTDNSLTGSGLTASDRLRVNWNDQPQADWLVTSTTSPAYIKNVPSSLRNYVAPEPVRPLWQKVTRPITYQAGSHESKLLEARLSPQVASTFNLQSGVGFELGAGIEYEVSGSTPTIAFRLTPPGQLSRIPSSNPRTLSARRVFVPSESRYEFDVYADVNNSSNVTVTYTVYGGLAIGGTN